ncbi:MAG: RDD family protein [Bacillales bacterium]|nr:RDD family protein [Bacillales bacterium]
MNESRHDSELEKSIAAETKQEADEGYRKDQSPHYAGFWMRFWAYLLDLIVIGSLKRILIFPVFRGDLPVFAHDLFAPIHVASAVLFYGYFLLFTKFTGQTIGKMVFGLKVVPLKEERLTWPVVLFRELIGRFTMTTIAILYIMVAFMPKKQGLHDYFADTVVLHEKTVEALKPAS